MGSEDMALSWVRGLSRDGGPLYLQVVECIEQAMSDERLRPGDRLPPQRQLAEHLHVDLTTVTRAYAEARRRNLLEARGAAGTFVSAPKIDLTQVIDLSMNVPPPPSGIDLDDCLRQGLTQVLMRSDVDVLMTYHLNGGSSADRSAAALWLAPMFARINEERIVVCPGAQPALAALILTLTSPGDVILAEPLVYPGLKAAAAQLGRRVVAVEADEDGALPDSVAALTAQHNARLLYLNPTLQNPSTRTMPQRRREDIAAMAIRTDIRIIEDDPYWLFSESSPRPVAHFAPRHVVYVSTLSKCLVPGLRTAYVVMPEGGPQEEFLTALRSFVLMSTPLMTALSTQWIHDGTAAALLKKIRLEANARQQIAGRLLGNAAAMHGGGIHVWQALPAHWTLSDFATGARLEGLSVISSDAFCCADQPPPFIRISLGRAKSRIDLVVALRRVADLLNRRAASARSIVV